MICAIYDRGIFTDRNKKMEKKNIRQCDKSKDERCYVPFEWRWSESKTPSNSQSILLLLSAVFKIWSEIQLWLTVIAIILLNSRTYSISNSVTPWHCMLSCYLGFIYELKCFWFHKCRIPFALIFVNNILGSTPLAHSFTCRLNRGKNCGWDFYFLDLTPLIRLQ